MQEACHRQAGLAAAGCAIRDKGAAGLTLSLQVSPHISNFSMENELARILLI
jgi:hypothetical protein